MLSATAYSFRRKSRLAISLSWIAGYTNVIVLIVTGETISHMTGNSTHLGNALGLLLLRTPGAGGQVLLFGSIIASFFCGALASGWMTEARPTPRRGSLHARPITVEAILLGVLTLLLARHGGLAHPPMVVLLIASFAMGLQNATITRISGSVVRTTHLTGVITDLGLELVLVWHWLVQSRSLDRGARWSALKKQHCAQRALLLMCILGSFLFGVTVGTLLFQWQGPVAMLLPLMFLSALVMVDFLRKPRVA